MSPSGIRRATWGRGFRLVRLYESRRHVLVTGGAGFTGSCLCGPLREQGNEDLRLDNRVNGTKREIEHLHNRPRIEFGRHELGFPLNVELDDNCSPACPASPIHDQHDSLETSKASMHGAINMLGAADSSTHRATMKTRLRIPRSTGSPALVALAGMAPERAVPARKSALHACFGSRPES